MANMAEENVVIQDATISSSTDVKKEEFLTIEADVFMNEDEGWQVFLDDTPQEVMEPDSTTPDSW